MDNNFFNLWTINFKKNNLQEYYETLALFKVLLVMIVKVKM